MQERETPRRKTQTEASGSRQGANALLETMKKTGPEIDAKRPGRGVKEKQGSEGRRDRKSLQMRRARRRE